MQQKTAGSTVPISLHREERGQLITATDGLSPFPCARTEGDASVSSSLVRALFAQESCALLIFKLPIK